NLGLLNTFSRPLVALRFVAVLSGAACHLVHASQCRLWPLRGPCFLRPPCPLSGVKSTCRFALQMSAYDLKRTSMLPGTNCPTPLLSRRVKRHTSSKGSQ